MHCDGVSLLQAVVGISCQALTLSGKATVGLVLDVFFLIAGQVGERVKGLRIIFVQEVLTYVLRD